MSAPATETTLPGHTRRRVWAHPELKSHSLAVLTFARLHLAPLAGTPKPELLAAVETGNLDDLLGPLAVTVELSAVRRLKLDLLTNALTVEYAAGGRRARLTVVFATPEAADSCFTKFWRRLGDGFALQPYTRDSWALARAPLALLGAALLATALLVLALSALEDLTTARALPDWRAVCALGGVAAGASQVWLFRRLSHPPRALEVMKA